MSTVVNVVMIHHHAISRRMNSNAVAARSVIFSGAVAALACERRKVKIQRIGFVQHEAWRAGKSLAQQRSKIAIDLDCVQAAI